MAVEELPCPDISDSGTQIDLGDDDYEYVPIGFPFDFYGEEHTDVAIQSNGGLLFADRELGFSNQCLPGPSNVVAVLWDDLNPSSGGEVYYETRGNEPTREFVVHWTTEHFGESATASFTAVLHEGTHEIQTCYSDTIFGSDNDEGASATVGIGGPSGSDSLQFSCNAANVPNGTQVRYFHP
jgi:hypothetical protein